MDSVRGDYQEDQVDSGGAGEHVGDEALVSGDIHKAETYTGFFQEGETEVDGDAAAFFLFEAIGVRAGQGFDQGGLAMVDVAGGADDDAFELGRACVWRELQFKR